MKKRILSSIILCIFVTTLSLGFIGCSKKNNSNSKNVIQNDTENNGLENKASENDIKEEQEGEIEIIKKEADISFIKNGLDKNVEPEFGTPWITSLGGKYDVCIEGRGEEGIEEVIGLIYLKDNNSGEKWSFQIDDDGNQFSPKKIEWIDDKHVAVIVGFAYGTIALGGNVYKLNVETGEVTMIHHTGDNKIQVLEINKKGKQLELDILVYEDDNYIESHIDKIIIDLE